MRDQFGKTLEKGQRVTYVKDILPDGVCLDAYVEDPGGIVRPDAHFPDGVRMVVLLSRVLIPVPVGADVVPGVAVVVEAKKVVQ